jgi:hypothetical protein
LSKVQRRTGRCRTEASPRGGVQRFAFELDGLPPAQAPTARRLSSRSQDRAALTRSTELPQHHIRTAARLRGFSAKHPPRSRKARYDSASIPRRYR